MISRENNVHDRGDVVLVAIAVYGTIFMMVKSVLAIYHHFKWLFTKCCTKLTDDKSRKDIIDKYWNK